MTSPFLDKPPSEWVACNALAFAIRDGFPVTEGHTLIVPRRLVPTWFEASREEQHAILDLVEQVRRDLDRSHSPDGYNIGINSGAAAGQTVMHLHVHVIPRYDGDMPDPRGGVRHVIPSKGNYLAGGPAGAGADGPGSTPAALSVGAPHDPFLPHLEPPFARATDIAILAAFVQDAGLELLMDMVRAALTRGARVRLLTGDYLHITQARALRRLLDWQEESWALSEEEEGAGEFSARVVEVSTIRATSFHPKAWTFRWTDGGTSFVGSSNISKAALRTGVEWNLRLDEAADPDGFARVVEAFETLWVQARDLDAPWVAEYGEKARQETRAMPAGEAEAEARRPLPEPHALQREALDALSASRAEGRQRALVVMATGVGKTLLAGFDVMAVAGDGPPPRVLVIAHRAEILRQAAETFRWLFPDARFGWFVGSRSDLSGDVVLASVQKLSRPEHLAALAPDAFDYVVVDEVHHAAAKTWRRVLAHLDPGFMLGLTATPERSDDADVQLMFDDHIAYRADIGRGISGGFLVPFAYHGLKDTTDYEPIPWRSRRFDAEALSAAVQTEARMQQMWKAWTAHPASRTIVFCCSIAHAAYVRDWLETRNLRVGVVHSGPGADDRVDALRRLAQGGLDAVCAVDLLNEGVDIPGVDRVVMLRPTESRVLFLQQLGRGLRLAENKHTLVVLDFVGNHDVFLNRVQTLLSLVDNGTELRDFLTNDAPARLPEGCSVEIEVEAKDLLRQLLPVKTENAAAMAYREWRQVRGRRPRAGEMHRVGIRPRSLGGKEGWFAFVQGEGDLSEAEKAAFAVGAAWLQHLETTRMTKSFKMVVLDVLLDCDALFEGLSLEEVALRSHRHLVRDPSLFGDLEVARELPEPRNPDPVVWQRYWRRNPVDAWTRGRWFHVRDGKLRSRIPTPLDASAREALAEMTRELVDLRLVEYRSRRHNQPDVSGFVCRVTWNKRDPILKLPSRKKMPSLPEGEFEVRLDQGAPWQFRFMKEFCNVARPAATGRNQLPDLLRRWFGPHAGRPGTGFTVRFSQQADQWWVAPENGQLIELPARGAVRAYPDLAAAAGRLGGPVLGGAPDLEVVMLPVEGADDRTFAVRALGHSMQTADGGIRDGDWLVMRWARDVPIGGFENRVAMVGVGDPYEGVEYLVKRIVRDGSGFLLRSDNPDFDDIVPDASATAYGVLIRHLSPEALAPPEGTLLEEQEIADRFGLEAPPGPGASRRGGHLFLRLEEPGTFASPTSLKVPVPGRRPAETAYVLSRVGDRWRYCGVGRWTGSAWTVPELDFDAWRALGAGRKASRDLPEVWRVRAEALVEVLGAREATWVEARGKACRIEGRSARGGLRVSGGPDGFKARTVSAIDIGWVLVARDAARIGGHPVDESFVNRHRYLAGTPKGSTRWIDTGWALVLTEGEGSRPAT